MFPIETTAGGFADAFIDVAKTPAGPAMVLIPYPNKGMFPQAVRATCSTKVKVLSQPVFLANSQIMVTAMDEAGSGGGAVSQMIKGPAKAIKGSAKVKAEGQPIVYLTCQMAQNGANANAVGLVTTPSQTKVRTAI